jgi:2-keto-4-pentenoate hydratase
MTVAEERLPHLHALAGRLAKAWTARGTIDGIAAAERPTSRDEAFAVQDRMAELIGDARSGWKVGATSLQMRAMDGFDGSVPGRLFAARTYRGMAHRIPSSEFPNAKMEVEFAFRLNADMPPENAPYTEDDVAGIVTLHPAIEIVGLRYPTAPDLTPPDRLAVIADNGGGFGFIAGDPVPDWQDIDFARHPVSLKINGGAEAENFLDEMRCNPFHVVADLANTLAERGLGLKAGEFVTTGAAAVPQDVPPGSRVVADFGRLGTFEIEFP